jgi:ubiquinone/menaquinone biosynthesis C-methylase UbiE
MKKTNILKIIFLIFLWVFFSQSCGEEPAPFNEDALDVPYVSTPVQVMEEMFRLAELKEGDVLLDLGCGDGRIPINAAVQYGIEAYGVDLNPERIRESIRNAQIAGVDHLVDFYEQDLFETDLTEATVITMYLLPSVNLRLRPKILTYVKPGTRVISHDFNMNEWIPDKDSMIFIEDEAHSVYYWMVPANVTGEWALKIDKLPLEVTIRFDQVFQLPQGKVMSDEEGWKVLEEKLKGDEFFFKLESPKLVCALNGKIKGDIMRGQAEVDCSGQKIAWEAVRNPDTKVPLDSLTQ